MRVRRLLAGGIFLTVWAAAWAVHGQPVAQKDALSGLKGIAVDALVEKSLQELVPARVIRSETETSLRQSAIPVLPQPTADNANAETTLVVSVDGLPLEDKREVVVEFVYVVTVQVREWVACVQRLPGAEPPGPNPAAAPRRPSLVMPKATIWKTGRFGIVGLEDIGRIRDSVAQCVGEFVRDYLEANRRGALAGPAAPRPGQRPGGERRPPEPDAP